MPEAFFFVGSIRVALVADFSEPFLSSFQFSFPILSDGTNGRLFDFFSQRKSILKRTTIQH